MLCKKFIAMCLSLVLVLSLTGCQKESVTVEALVESYLECTARVDYTTEVKVHADLLYHGEWEAGDSL